MASKQLFRNLLTVIILLVSTQKTRVIAQPPPRSMSCPYSLTQGSLCQEGTSGTLTATPDSSNTWNVNGLLKWIRDKDQKILKQSQYHYQGQQ